MGRTAPNKRTGNNVPAHSQGKRSAGTTATTRQSRRSPSPESVNFPSPRERNSATSRCSSSSTPNATRLVETPYPVRQIENISPVAGFSSVCIPTLPTTVTQAGVRSGQQRRIMTERNIYWLPLDSNIASIMMKRPQIRTTVKWLNQVLKMLGI